MTYWCLPGAREIRRVQSLVESGGIPTRNSVRLLPLFGELAPEDQDLALTPSAPGMRKVVLATNIAETSLTIQGVRVVVDSGLVRRSLFRSLHGNEPPGDAADLPRVRGPTPGPGGTRGAGCLLSSVE